MWSNSRGGGGGGGTINNISQEQFLKGTQIIS